ncbi:MAG: hypothetical protein ACK4HQ_08775 [Brevinematales bacterium]
MFYFYLQKLTRSVFKEEGEGVIQELKFYIKKIKEKHTTRQDIQYLRNGWFILEQIYKRFDEVGERGEATNHYFAMMVLSIGILITFAAIVMRLF